MHRIGSRTTEVYMNTEFNIFSVRSVEFEKGKLDPFGFDDFSEKLSAKYLPFSGTVRKPIYFFFVPYVNWLLKNNKLRYKKKEEVRLRLEKLLVCSWKNKEENLKKKNIIGTNQKQINPFKGNDGKWVVQTCFKIYEASVNKIITDTIFIDKYKQDNREEDKLLDDFLAKEGVLDKRNEIILMATLKKFGQRNHRHSIFNGNHQLTPKYKNIFKKYLRNAIWNTNQNYYYDIEKFFMSTKNLGDKIYRRILNNDRNYPFRALNKWFSAFVIAVDKDINNAHSKKDWDNADKRFNELEKHGIGSLKQRPEPKSWIDWNGNRYVKKEGKDFDEDGWNALVRRATRATQQDQYFYDFRHTALISLLKELY